MLRSAYLTTGLAIKAVSSLSKANIFLHGQEHIPTGPKVFVVNHFTRIETLLLPYYIYQQTHKPVLSLAASSLFVGGLEKFFDMVGVVSTRDPHRDQLIIKRLLTGEADWIIFPEGSMIKTKKIMADGRYLVADDDGPHQPHTGAAALALRTELFRRFLLANDGDQGGTPQKLAAFGLSSPAEIETRPVHIVPINLTYYPIRAAENIALHIASKLVKDMSERMVEEIMTEGTMLLSGVDIDIRFGAPIKIGDFLQPEWLKRDLAGESDGDFKVSKALKKEMFETVSRLMQQYMHAIYTMTTINHEHLFAAFLRLCPAKKIKARAFKERMFYAASTIAERESHDEPLYLHRSLRANQAHLFTDDRFGKYANFLKLAEEKGVVRTEGTDIICNRAKMVAPVDFQRGRIDNPIEIMANEIEPLVKLWVFLRRIARMPLPIVKLAIIHHLLRREKQDFLQALAECRLPKKEAQRAQDGGFLLPGFRRKIGVVLVHSYLASPAEVRSLAHYLRRRGLWVMAPRLPGHGTSAEDLAQRTAREWVESVESAFVLLGTITRHVVLGGVGFGGNLVLDLASRLQNEVLAGVFAVCPPFSIKDYASRTMAGKDLWARLLSRVKREENVAEYVDVPNDMQHGNYSTNPLATTKEVREFLEAIAERYATITAPTLILQADNNPLVDPKGTHHLYETVGSAVKEYCLLNDNKHVVINGEGSSRVLSKIYNFINRLEPDRPTAG